MSIEKVINKIAVLSLGEFTKDEEEECKNWLSCLLSLSDETLESMAPHAFTDSDPIKYHRMNSVIARCAEIMGRIYNIPHTSLVNCQKIYASHEDLMSAHMRKKDNL